MIGREIKAKTAVVASPSTIASEAGVKILKSGGNAIDAAIATAFALNVVAPGWSGLGGGGFIVAYMSNTEETVAIDYRETAPSQIQEYRLRPDGKVENEANAVGYKSVAVPGTLAGLSLTLNDYGTMSLKEILEPTITYAKNGFRVTRFWHRCVKSNLSGALDKISQFPETAKVLTKNGHVYEFGKNMVLRDLGRTFRKIAEAGPYVFYNGEVADIIANDMAENDGWIKKEDLIKYEAKTRRPILGAYRGYEIVSMPPPSSGATLVEILNILEDFDLKELCHNSPETIHLIVEAITIAFTDRKKYVADPKFVSIPTDELTSKEYAARLRREMDDHKAKKNTSFDLLDEEQAGSTAHLSVIDGQGNMVSLTESLECFLGSGVTISNTGLLMNDHMHDFDLNAKSPNCIKPNKRPLSNMAPTIIMKDGSPYMVIGSAGGQSIIPSIIQVIVNTIDFDMTPQEAIESPRFSCQHDRIYVETRIPQNVRRKLEMMGYEIIAGRTPIRALEWMPKGYNLFHGAVQVASLDQEKGKVHGGADPRQDSGATGY